MGNKVTTHKVEVRQGEVEELSLMHAVTGADGRGHDEQPGEHAREQWAHQPRNLYPNIGDCPTRYKIEAVSTTACDAESGPERGWWIGRSFRAAVWQELVGRGKLPALGSVSQADQGRRKGCGHDQAEGGCRSACTGPNRRT
jgi:hypothetical protein